MKTIGELFVVAISILLIQGCFSNTIKIKAPISEYQDIVTCITDPESHGQCKTVSRSGTLVSYFDALKQMELPRNKEIVDDFQKDETDETNFSITFKNYRKKYQKQNWKSVYNYDAAKIAKKTLSSETNIKIYEIFNHILNKKDKSTSDAIVITMETKKLNVFFDNFLEAYSLDGINSLRWAVYKDMEKYGEKSDPESNQRLSEYNALIEDLSYLEAYFNAYFRHGKFIRGTLKVSELKTKILEYLKVEAPFLKENQIQEYFNRIFKKITGREYSEACPKEKASCKLSMIAYNKRKELLKRENPPRSEEEIENIAKEYRKKLFKDLTGKEYTPEACSKETGCEISFAGTLESSQFVTRAGVEYGFPHITVSIDPLSDKKILITEIDWNIVGSEVVKVFIEAVGDSRIGLPADPRSTACKEKIGNCYPLNGSDDNKKNKKINETVCKKGKISEDDFSSVNEFSDKIDTLVSNAVGKTIRGGGWISLNNEAFAKMIESLIGTTSKKIAEKAKYCIYSCKNCEGKLDWVDPPLSNKTLEIIIKY